MGGTNSLIQSVEKLEAVMEYKHSNKLHREIGIDAWILHRSKVPKHIPKEQVDLYVFKIVKKERGSLNIFRRIRGAIRRNFYF